MSDPAVAADVAAEGDLWPIVRAIVETIGDAVRDLQAMLKRQPRRGRPRPRRTCGTTSAGG
jgi:hypothetical protein